MVNACVDLCGRVRIGVEKSDKHMSTDEMSTRGFCSGDCGRHAHGGHQCAIELQAVVRAAA